MPGVSSTWVTSQWKFMPFPSHFSAAINTQSPETVEKVEAVFAKYAGEDLTVETHPAYRELFGILRTPIRRRIEKANKQIKGAKKELGQIGRASWRERGCKYV